MEIGIQVSSLKPRLLTAAQVQEAFARMGTLGCKNVQLQWIDPSVSVDIIAQAMAAHQIRSVSVQDFYETVLSDLKYYTDLNCATSGKWLCVSRIPDRLKTAAGLDAFIEELRNLQKQLDPLQQTLCFHPVSADYNAVPGMNAVTYLLNNMPELSLCLDLYHLNRNCSDMPAFIRQWGNRICMVHFKDSVGSKLVPAGQGDTDWSGVVPACIDTGIPYAFAEQEKWERDPYDCLQEAMDWLEEQKLACKK